ncbi:MAG: tetrahydromethanopterin S-methyltransferase subunit H, partial [Candidatus Heimdallarchaeota archaeon]|nr:tetrahydromethanopterin S-methyltransferase subunit H [Candidatus Heimdallarchaeota archaeon]
MFSYEVEQKTFTIGGVKVGGIPAVNPTVLVGSIFYHGDKLVLDKSGSFDKPKAQTVIKQMDEMKDRTAMPSMLDVVGPSPELMREYLAFIVDLTDVPLLIDGAGDFKAGLAGLRYAKEQGFLDRC